MIHIKKIKLGPVPIDTFINKKIESDPSNKEYYKYFQNQLEIIHKNLKFITEIRDYSYDPNNSKYIKEKIYYMTISTIPRKININFNKKKSNISKSADISSYVSSSRMFICPPDEDEEEFYENENKKYDNIESLFKIKECDEFGNIKSSQHLLLKSNNTITKQITNNTNTKNQFKKYMPSELDYKPKVPKKSLQKNYEFKDKYTIIVKNIPIGYNIRYVCSKLHELFSYNTEIIKINVLKSCDNTTKGIAFIDFLYKQNIDYILEISKYEKFSIDNCIIQIEEKL